jgi:hypothetical protein
MSTKPKQFLMVKVIIWLSLLTYLQKDWLDDWREISEEQWRGKHNSLGQTRMESVMGLLSVALV